MEEGIPTTNHHSSLLFLLLLLLLLLLLFLYNCFPFISTERSFTRQKSSSGQQQLLAWCQHKTRYFEVQYMYTVLYHKPVFTIIIIALTSCD